MCMSLMECMTHFMMRVVESLGCMSLLVGSLGSELCSFREFGCDVVLSEGGSIILGCFGEMAKAAKVALLVGLVEVTSVVFRVSVLSVESYTKQLMLRKKQHAVVSVRPTLIPFKSLRGMLGMSMLIIHELNVFVNSTIISSKPTKKFMIWH